MAVGTNAPAFDVSLWVGGASCAGSGNNTVWVGTFSIVLHQQSTAENYKRPKNLPRGRGQVKSDLLLDDVGGFSHEGSHADVRLFFVTREPGHETRVIAQSRQDTKDADRRLAELSTKMGELANSMGRLVEDVVAPSVPACFQKLFGVEDPEWLVRAKKRHRDSGQLREFHVVAWDGNVFLNNSTKSLVRPEDVDPFVALLPEIRAYFPEAEGRRIVGSFASFYLEPSMVRAAERAGLFVFGLGRGLLEVLNSPGFKPREF